MKKIITPTHSKFSVEIKQSARHKYYMGSFQVNVDTEEELEEILETVLPKIIKKVRILNKEQKGRGKEEEEDTEVELNEYDRKIYSKLKTLRTKFAADKNIPAYFVFHNRVLKLLAIHKPKTKEEMLAVKGIGQKKYESYGKQFLDYLQVILNES
jgi:superfamily II DNA helicase RecQ